MLKTNTLAFYGTTPQLASHAEFFQGGFSGDIAVVKDSGDETTELLISGIFQVDRQNFFMGPEGAYMPSGAFKREFSETKLSCQLIAVQKDAAFKTACADFPAIVGNVRALEKLIPSKKGTTLVSCIREANGVTSIQVSHSLFTKKDENVDLDTASVEEARTAEWPVQERTRMALEHAATTHMVCPLPAFDQNHASIVPGDYLRKLCGAVVIVHFALIHYYFKQDKKSVFSGVLREMVVLREPPPPPTNPLKRSVYGSGPSFSHMPATKKLRQTMDNQQHSQISTNDRTLYTVWGFLFGRTSGPRRLSVRVDDNGMMVISGNQYLFPPDASITSTRVQLRHRLYIVFFDQERHQTCRETAAYVFVRVLPGHQRPLHIRAEDDLQDIMNALLVFVSIMFPSTKRANYMTA
ncbi:hypothetical protein M404DRAFT_20467 [Pisolithus tinctorius Marx 270]|uniref:Uncharacterized protein n=1 Tax=Pisolithus tinctorius Marx 270 TaxID=870435 RepID=A0A0C3PT68_PISTI|nr:hypothetical protein M404DRAFT_20467 [Pisolithus tinctorius Marx 270]